MYKYRKDRDGKSAKRVPQDTAYNYSAVEMNDSMYPRPLLYRFHVSITPFESKMII